MADADGQCGQPAGVQRAHLVQDVKALLQHPAHVAFLDHGDVAAVGDAAQKAVTARDVLLQQAVDGFQLLGLFAVFHVVEQFVIAVDDEDQAGGAALGIFVQSLFIKRIVDEIDDAGAAAALGGTGVGGKAALPHRDVLPVRAGTYGQFQLREYALDRAGHHIGAVQHFFVERAVVPQNTPVRNQHRGDGQAGQAVLDAAVVKVCAAQLPCHIGAQAAAQKQQYADRNDRQHQRRDQPLRAKHRYRHDHRRQRDQQQQHDGRGIQGIRMFHTKASTFPPGGRAVTLPAEWAGSSGCAWCGGRYSSTALRARAP